MPKNTHLVPPPLRLTEPEIRALQLLLGAAPTLLELAAAADARKAAAKPKIVVPPAAPIPD